MLQFQILHGANTTDTSPRLNSARFQRIWFRLKFSSIKRFLKVLKKRTCTWKRIQQCLQNAESSYFAPPSINNEAPFPHPPPTSKRFTKVSLARWAELKDDWCWPAAGEKPRQSIPRNACAVWRDQWHPVRCPCESWKLLPQELEPPLCFE